ncbi:intradiol ring-cleavage dioxygenase [Cupriavidus campinensis]|uniref:Intradiol ring-cleavage dioxygenase n=1 Tax=Cupriavidus campinensis TaxID=151783 RepID=A0ABY3EFN2_9BURK|nr:intradiol ring-cleavage dioxygenase [Cupriavidus campinensis]TSP09533.1 intradiol ring-cleavage dioxygenase [Cupriavidus campinensis]
MPDSPASPPSTASIPRRRHLLALGLGSAGLTALARVAPAAEPRPATAATLPLTAQTTEGPYYFDAGKIRQDITEGQPGVPLEVRFTVVDVQGRPLAGQRVDLWHCNAAGVYSGYDGQRDGQHDGQHDDKGQRISTRGQTFLRGSQPVGADGVAMFRTIYPGWYAGRATHLHLKVLDPAGRAHLTTQCFLPDALNEYLYSQLPAYRRRQVRGTLNSNDGIALMAGETVLGAVREAHDRYVATLTLVVDPAGTAPREGFSDHPPPGPPPMSRDGRRPPPPPGQGEQAAPAAGSARAAALIPGVRL